MGTMHRRDVVRLLAAAPLASAFDWSSEDAERARRAAIAARRTAATGHPFAARAPWRVNRIDGSVSPNRLKNPKASFSPAATALAGRPPPSRP